MNNIAHCFVYFSTEPNGGLQLYNCFYSMRCLLSSDLSTLKNSVLKYLYNVIISYILFIHSFIHEWNCSQSTTLRSTDSCGHLIFIDLSVTAGWSTQTTSNMSQSKHLHISSCCLNHSESSVQSSSTLSTNHPVYHHSNQKRKEEQTEVITEWL